MKRTSKTLPIVWQRLVKNGETCPRCGGTLREIERAVRQLKRILRLRGITPTLEIKEINDESFRAQPSESNRIWIAGKPLEELIQAEAGASRCSSVCGDSDCRTLEVDGATFETIPHDLLIKAALTAVSCTGAPSVEAQAINQPVFAKPGHKIAKDPRGC